MTPPKKKDFFDDLKDWSERKLQLLEKYVEAASKIMGSGNMGEVYYVDGFAGEGTYEDNSKGSPVRIAELAQRYKIEAKPYSLKCINIEENKNRFANLQATTVQFGDLVTNLKGTFTENIEQIVRRIGNRPTICFLDPFGIKGLDWKSIKRLINRGRYASTDFWIRFDTQITSRLSGFFTSSSPNAEQYLATLTEVFGIENRTLLYTKLTGQTPEERFRNALYLYVNLLASEFKKVRGAGYAGVYPIKTLEGKTKYYLVFASGHKKGFTLASEVVYGVEETYQREVQEYSDMRSLQPSLFSIDPTKEEIFNSKVEHLKNDIWKACQGKTLSRIDIYTSILNSWFGKIKSTHLTQALKDLQREGRILQIDGALSQDATLFTFRA